jgi:hypothetical protein
MNHKKIILLEKIIGVMNILLICKIKTDNLTSAFSSVVTIGFLLDVRLTFFTLLCDRGKKASIQNGIEHSVYS